MSKIATFANTNHLITLKIKNYEEIFLNYYRIGWRSSWLCTDFRRCDRNASGW